MGVYIKGMEMPKDGELLCVNIYPDGKVCINLDLECKRIATAVPVPPHGRLIDAGELIKWADAIPLTEDGGIDINDFDEYLDNAPTIIEAEEE